MKATKMIRHAWEHENVLASFDEGQKDPLLYLTIKKNGVTADNQDVAISIDKAKALKEVLDRVLLDLTGPREAPRAMPLPSKGEP